MRAWGRAVGRWRTPRKGEAQDAQNTRQRALPHTGKPLLGRETPSSGPQPRKHPRYEDTGLRAHSPPILKGNQVQESGNIWSVLMGVPALWTPPAPESLRAPSPRRARRRVPAQGHG